MRIVAAAIALFATGCLEDSLLQCGALLCPPGTTCLRDRCVETAALTACDAQPDGTTCASLRIEAGVCRAGECIAAGCGNNIVEVGEQCDDGNVVAGDACAADCGSISVCPMPGDPLHLQARINTATAQDCIEYSESVQTDLAVALCRTPSSFPVFKLFQGPIDGRLNRIAEIEVLYNAMESPRLVPEGDFIYAYGRRTGIGFEYVVFARNPDGTWRRDRTFDIAQYGTRFGTPTRGPTRRMMVVDDTAMVILEIEIDGNATRQIERYTFLELGLASVVQAPQLSADGLRLVFAGQATSSNRIDTYHSDRAALGGRFRLPLGVIAKLDYATPFFLAETCERLYFGALGAMLYREQGLLEPEL